MKCDYCGNTSGKTDMRGNCVSCGAQFSRDEIDVYFDLLKDDMCISTCTTTIDFFWKNLTA